MSLFYQQSESPSSGATMARFGIQMCLFKKIRLDRASFKKTFRYAGKPHHHTGFEIHIVSSGEQSYSVEGKEFLLSGGTFLIIPPDTPHHAISCSDDLCRYSITFTAPVLSESPCFCSKITPRMADTLEFIGEEFAQHTEVSAVLIEHAVLELLLTLFRMAGMEETPLRQSREDNATLLAAKKYIQEHIEQAFTVSTVAQYCYLSEKQLTRIFTRFEGVSPGEYIKRQKALHIEMLLADSSLSLRAISERMNFSSEYYFNAFVKKFAGLPPGEYRKMLNK